ncbi:MAG: hypothetical protein CSB24_07515, partial [Deltaproteobacteria bacterium]
VTTDSKGFFSAEIVVEGGPGIKDVKVTATPQGGNSASSGLGSKPKPSILGDWKYRDSSGADKPIITFYENGKMQGYSKDDGYNYGDYTFDGNNVDIEIIENESDGIHHGEYNGSLSSDGNRIEGSYKWWKERGGSGSPYESGTFVFTRI